MSISLERRDAVAIIAFDRPEVGNAIDIEFCRKLSEHGRAVAADPSVRAVLIRGNGNHFCVGGDLKLFASLGEQATPVLREMADVLHEGVIAIHRLTVPVVVAVHGNAAGAGLSLACLGDICLAARSSKFRMAYTAVGLTPDGGGSWMLPRLVGPRVAADLALTNRLLDAEEAQRVGIVTRVVDDEVIHDEAEALAAQLADGPSRAFAATKRLLAGSAATRLEDQLAQEAISISTQVGAPEGQEGIAAFLGKRAPKYH